MRTTFDVYDVVDGGFEQTLNSSTWMGIALILAVIGGILVYFLFLKKDNEDKYTGFVKYLYEFLSFKKNWLESILKISYLILAIYLTLISFELIKTSFVVFLITLISSNLILRVVYELSLLLLTICRNTTEINKKLK